MKKVSYHDYISKIFGICIVVSLLFSTSLYAQEDTATQEAETFASTEDAAAVGDDPAKGKQLFNQNCAACHALNRKMTGPALANVETRLAEDEGLDKEWLYTWIRNSAGMISAGDAYAVKIYNEYNQAAMNAFPTLSDQDIDDILAYTAAPPPAPAAAATATETTTDGGTDSGITNEIVLGVLILVFGLLVMMLFLVNQTLRRIAEANGLVLEKEKAAKRTPIWKAFAQNQFLVLVFSIFLLLAAAYYAYGWFMQVGVDPGLRSNSNPFITLTRFMLGITKLSVSTVILLPEFLSILVYLH